MVVNSKSENILKSFILDTFKINSANSDRKKFFEKLYSRESRNRRPLSHQLEGS